MAYGIKYNGTIQGLDAVTYTFEILERDYAGASTALLAAKNALKVRFGAGGKKDPYVPILASLAELEIFEKATTVQDEIFSGDENKYRLRIKKGANVFWLGKILTDLYRGSLDLRPRSTTITAIDGLGVLQNKDFTLSGRETLIKTISEILLQIGFDLDIHIALNWFTKEMLSTDDPAAKIRIDRDLFRNPDGTYMDSFTVLEKILSRFGLQLKQLSDANGHVWNLVQLELLANATYKIFTYDKDGVAITSIAAHDPKVTIAAATQHSKRLSGGDKSALKALKNARVHFLPDADYKRLISNSDFEDWDGASFAGWSKTAGITVTVEENSALESTRSLKILVDGPIPPPPTSDWIESTDTLSIVGAGHKLRFRLKTSWRSTNAGHSAGVLRIAYVEIQVGDYFLVMNGSTGELTWMHESLVSAPGVVQSPSSRYIALDTDFILVNGPVYDASIIAPVNSNLDAGGLVRFRFYRPTHGYGAAGGTIHAIYDDLQVDVLPAGSEGVGLETIAEDTATSNDTKREPLETNLGDGFRLSSRSTLTIANDTTISKNWKRGPYGDGDPLTGVSIDKMLAQSFLRLRKVTPADLHIATYRRATAGGVAIEVGNVLVIGSKRYAPVAIERDLKKAHARGEWAEVRADDTNIALTEAALTGESGASGGGSSSGGSGGVTAHATTADFVTHPIVIGNYAGNLATYHGLEVENLAGDNPVLLYKTSDDRWHIGKRTTSDTGAQTGTLSLDPVLTRTSIDTITNKTWGETLKFASDNTYDIGLSSASRPRDLFLARNAIVDGSGTFGGAITGSAQTASGLILTRNTNDSGGPGILGRKSRGSLGAPTAISANDVLFQLRTEAYVNGAYRDQAQYTIEAVATIGATFTPTQHRWWVTNDAGTSFAGMTLDKDGNLYLPTSAGQVRVTAGVNPIIIGYGSSDWRFNAYGGGSARFTIDQGTTEWLKIYQSDGRVELPGASLAVQSNQLLKQGFASGRLAVQPVSAGAGVIELFPKTATTGSQLSLYHTDRFADGTNYGVYNIATSATTGLTFSKATAGSTSLPALWTFQGDATVTGLSNLNGNVLITNGSPTATFWESDQAVDTRQTRFTWASGIMYLQAMSDAGAHQRFIQSWDRSNSNSQIYGSLTVTNAGTFGGVVTTNTTSWTKLLMQTGAKTWYGRVAEDSNSGVWLATNAVWTGSVWNRDEISVNSFVFANGHIGNDRWEWRSAAAGANPIAWTNAMLLTRTGDLTLKGNQVISGTGVNTVTEASTWQSSSYTKQSAGWRAGVNGQADFRYLYVDELHAKAFIADLEQALAGSQIIAKSVARIASDFALPAAGASADLVVEQFAGFNGRVFVDGDMIRIRTFSRPTGASFGGALTIADAWGTVVFVSANDAGNPPTQTYSFTRSTGADAGTGSGTIKAGTLAIDYGVSGDGFWEVDNTTGKPYARTATWTTHPRTGVITRVRMGELGSSKYGILGLMPNGTDTAFRLDQDGAKIAGGYFSATDIWAGNSSLANASTKIVIGDFGDGGTPKIALGATADSISMTFGSGFYAEGSGNFRVGNTAAGVLAGGISWDGTTFRVRANSADVITATTGVATVAGWTATNTTFSSTGVAIVSGASAHFALGATLPTAWNSGTGVWLGNDGKFLAGNAAGNRLQFSGTEVTVVATNAQITGTTGWLGSSGVFSWSGTSVTAGGFTIASSELTATNFKVVSGAANTARIEVGTGSNIAGVNSPNAGGDVAFWAGSTHANRATALFVVTAAGALTATSATIKSAASGDRIEMSTGGLVFVQSSKFGGSESLTFKRGNGTSLISFGLDGFDLGAPSDFLIEKENSASWLTNPPRFFLKQFAFCINQLSTGGPTVNNGELAVYINSSEKLVFKYRDSGGTLKYYHVGLDAEATQSWSYTAGEPT